MGGSLALTAAGRHPERVAAAASFHGARLATAAPDSPHLLAGRMRAQIYVGIAGIDASFTPEEQQRLEAALTHAGVRHTISVYEGVEHGFAVGGTRLRPRRVGAALAGAARAVRRDAANVARHFDGHPGRGLCRHVARGASSDQPSPKNSGSGQSELASLATWRFKSGAFVSAYAPVRAPSRSTCRPPYSDGPRPSLSPCSWATR